MADLVDWADVAAVGVMLTYGEAHCLPPLMAVLTGDHPDRAYVRIAHGAIASALREAYEAGIRRGYRQGVTDERG